MVQAQQLRAITVVVAGTPFGTPEDDRQNPRIKLTQLGTVFDPPGCAKVAEGTNLPQGLKGNMAATTAEGDGNRFITIALETNEPLPVVEPSDECKKITFSGNGITGTVQTVPTPQIDGAKTLGVHRSVNIERDGKTQTGELYSYRAYFGKYQVMVTANPVLAPDKPVAPVDTKRAEDLLVAAVAAIRGKNS